MTSTETTLASASAAVMHPETTNESIEMGENEPTPNFASPPTPSSDASKSTCSAPTIEVEIDEDSPAASPIGGSLISEAAMKPDPMGDLRLSSSAARKIMFDQYQPWVLSTYGDAAKTKTITAKKYARIVALLRYSTGVDKSSGSSEATGSEAAKFRLWVKSKGFHLGPPAGHPEYDQVGSHDLLYLPTGTDKVSKYDQLKFLCLLRRIY